jgi:predicted nucleotidyltransferase
MSDRADIVAALGIVARRFGTMLDEVAFLGGASAVLHVTDAGAPPPRPTKDVDVIVEVASTTDYLGRLSDELRARGFEVDVEEGAPLCRWVVDGIKVDVMPTREDVLGLKNRWFDAALRHPTRYRLPDGQEILLVGAPYFVATKLEAFVDGTKLPLREPHRTGTPDPHRRRPRGWW